MLKTKFLSAALSAALLVLAVCNSSVAQAGEDGASIIMYHRFGENDYPSTNVRLEQLDAHIAELSSGDYTVLSLGEIVHRLQTGEDFPENTVGISIDDAYLSVFSEAWPRFKKAGLPFTVFVATDPVDSNYSGYMTWAQLRDMQADPLVSIGSQTASHLHMIEASSLDIDADIEKSNALFQSKLGAVPKLMAYPYGEFDGHVIERTKSAGFIAGFGQHSGAFGGNDDLFQLPRFAMNENYGDIDRLKTAAMALPIQITDFNPTDTVVSSANNPPLIGFTVLDNQMRTQDIACYSNHEGKLAVESLGPRIEVRMTKPLPQGRTRLNCTLPTGTPGEGRFRWLGHLLYVK
jgi:peptidoglycan/xylan/chitin deacetylase (PgdA/CDA1 family)